MAHLARSVASLRFFGDDLNPGELTELLGCAPTRAWPKGRVERGRSGREIVKKSGGWLLDAGEAEPEDLDGQVSELLSKLTNDPKIWSGISERFKMDLFCGWFMKDANEGVSISSATMRALSERHIELTLDIYGPDERAEPTPELAQ